jgi:cellulose synthase operon protein C
MEMRLFIAARLSSAEARRLSRFATSVRREAWPHGMARGGSLGEIYPMHKTFNVRFVGWLLLAVFALGIGVHFLHAFQVKRNASALRTRAEQAQQDDPQLAAQCYERYLVLVPTDTEALARFGLLLAEDRLATTRRARMRACELLERVLRTDPERPDVRRQFVRVAMGLGRFADAKENLTALLKAAPADGELLFRLAQCEEADGRYNVAANHYQQAIDGAKGQSEKWAIKSQVRLASLLRRRLEKPAAADKVISDLARQAPDDADSILVVAEAAVDKGDLKSARSWLERAASQHPGDGRLTIALAQLAARAGKRQEAIAGLRKALPALSSGRAQTLLVLAELLLDENSLDEARPTVARLEREQAGEPQVAYLRGRLLIAEGNWPAACQLLESCRPALAAAPDLAKKVDLCLAQCYERMGNLDQELTACRRALQVDPLWLPAQTMLASALSSAGRLDEAIDQCRKAVPRLPGLRLVVARLLVLKNLRRPPGERRWEEAEQLLADIEQSLPGSSETAVLQAEILAAKGALEAAAKVLQSARQRRPKDAQLWIALAKLTANQQQPDEALAVLEQASKAIGDRVDLRLARAEILLRGSAASTRADVAALQENVCAFSDSERQQLWRGLADACYRAGAVGEAGCLWAKIARQQPYDTQVRLALLELALEASDYAALPRQVEELRRIEGEGGVLWRYGEAARLALQASMKEGNAKDLNAAAALLDEVRKQRPSWPLPVALAGVLSELRGDQDRALTSYVQAIGLGEHRPGVIRRTALLLYERRRYAEADDLIRRLPENAASPASLARVAADAAYRRGDKRRGLELARAVARNSTDFHDHIWLGQMLEAAGQVEEAEQAFRAAIKPGETSPVPWTALVMHLVTAGRKDVAETVLKEAAEKVAARDRPLMLARCHETLGNRTLAEQFYGEALRSDPDNVPIACNVAAFYLQIGERGKAIKALRQVLAKQAPDQARGWARRNLAILLAVGGPGPDWDEAWALMEPRTHTGSRTPGDQRALAIILAAHPGRKFEAIAYCEWLLGHETATADDRFMLAQLYAARREPRKAREQMQSVLASDGDKPRYLAHHIRDLLRAGELDHAEQWLSKLEALAPNSWDVANLKSRLLLAQHKPDEAAARVVRYAAQKGANIGLAADFLDELRQFKPAEDLYRKHLAQTHCPDSALALARNLAQQQRIDEALELCDKAWGRCAPEVVARASLAILRNGRADQTQIRHVGQRIEEAIEKAPEVSALLAALGDFRSYQGNFSDAETAYRAALGKDPYNVVALNNLACLLALRGQPSDEALRLVNRAISCSGPAPALLDTRAAALVCLGRLAEAITEWKEVVAANPSATYHLRLARAYYLAKDRNAARQELGKSRDLGLQLGNLHPLERDTYRQLVEELDR